MPTPGKFEMLDLGGGLNDGMHPSAINDSQWAELVNWIPFGKKLIRRGGITNVIRNVLPYDFNSVFAYTDAQDETHIIMGGDGGLFRINNDGDVQTIPSTSAFSAGTTGAQWQFVQVNGIGYAVREGVGVRRFASDFHSPAGINPPGWTATLAQGAAGAIGAGDYIGVVTYRNSRTGAESNPGAASNTLTLAASKRINWSGLQPSSDAQVDEMRLWRTAADQQDEYFLVDTIPVSDITYVDNKTTDQLGALVSNNNGLPPAGAIICCLWDDCLVLSDGRDAFVSEILLPESFSDTVLNAYRDDGYKITGLVGWNKRLIVAKTNKIHYFTRTGARSFERGTLSERHGCYSHRSLKVIGDQLYWFGGDNIYRSSGYSAEPIVNTEVRHVLDSISPLDYDKVAGAVVPALNLYLLSVKTLDATTDNPDKVIAYNYRDDHFTIFDHASGKAPVDYTEATASSAQGDLGPGSTYAVFNDRRVYQYLDVAPFDNDITSEDWTDSTGALRNSPISCRAKTKAFGREQGGLLSALRRVWLLAQRMHVDYDLKKAKVGVSVYLDMSTTAYKTRTLDLQDTPDWHVMSLNTSRKLASLIQVGLVYSDEPTIELSHLALDVMQFSRVRRVA